MISKKKSLVIYAKRWLQRSYGNTYHSVKVVLNGRHLGTEKNVYGYGDHYLQTAAEIIKKNSTILNKKPMFTNWKAYLRDNKKYNISIGLDDVSSMREMKNI